MRLVVDANILFAALVKEGSTADLLIIDKLQLFAPEFLFLEFTKYEELILKKLNVLMKIILLFLYINC